MVSIARIPVTHIFFDVDGTLVDFNVAFRAGLYAAAAVVSQRAGQAVGPRALVAERDRIVARTRGYRSLLDIQREALGQVLRERGVNDEDAVSAADRAFYDAFEVALQPYEDVAHTLQLLHDRGFILTAATNGTTSLLQTPFFRLLHYTFGADEIGISKPHPRFFAAALEKAGATPERSLMVGDRIDNDLEPAASIGMQAILIDREGTSEEGLFPAIRSLRELLDLVELPGRI